MTGQECYELFMRLSGAAEQKKIRNARYVSAATTLHLEPNWWKVEWTGKGLRLSGNGHALLIAFDDISGTEFQAETPAAPAMLRIDFKDNPGAVWVNFKAGVK
ncbi:hypothetical protein [Deinococcus soli (ex Cha et al. 2016)]|uniref:hypothetical protein n=1 Tax=Deinococcus soli (ex Cha et al. 2016) TaxID=1309411 RepID=UPI00166C2025|nr:hypothetical protein [Deinococcus soli (ex Cha et al. 2016)]GGB71511.1 hypothetical protein GCM10008019_29580 [Deinococcus soli (ex Cha et al. 2016)]